MNLERTYGGWLLKILFTLISITFTFTSSGQTLQLQSFDSLNSRTQTHNDTLYILNFWATWCKPCIEELPAFGQVNEKYAAREIRLILVNLDFHSKVESQVKPFIERKNIKSQVIHITDPDPNEWINRVDSSWSGAIPATVFYKNGETLFFKEGSLSYEELNTEIQKSLNKL
jgi:thiol-disulfide isomerase/thioredoxin